MGPDSLSLWASLAQLAADVKEGTGSAFLVTFQQHATVK
jgi:hypothetical protein